MSFLINERTHQVLASSVELALTRRERRKGLLGRETLDADAAMWISPCFSIHTVAMRFPIDVVFIDGDGRAVHLVHRLQPWRIAASMRAHCAIELAAGRLEACDVELGDRLYLSPHAPRASDPAAIRLMGGSRTRTVQPVPACQVAQRPASSRSVPRSDRVAAVPVDSC